MLRCEAAGGFISTDSGSPRVGGNLEVTRSFGDFDVKGISASPHIQTIELTTDDAFVIIASDGLWDVVAPQEAVRMQLLPAPVLSQHLLPPRRRLLCSAVCLLELGHALLQVC